MRFVTVKNKKGPDLVYSTKSGLKILEEDGLYFKNHSRSGKLEIYEDWRQPAKVRAHDLAGKLGLEDIAGLMLFTSHLAVPSVGDRAQTYNGKTYKDSQAEAWDLTDIQKEYFQKNRIKHTLVTTIESPRVLAKWNNKVQELSESMPWGIPVVNSSDPRHGITADTEFNEGNGGKISQWPEQIGLAATFDPQVAHDFGKIAASEYRAMGLSLILGPQADLGTEPRWMRYVGTFGENARLVSDFVRANIDGFQTTTKTKGWGPESINTMVKHWPGGAPCEAGRDAHFGYGKYAVYPGHNFAEHQLPFKKGAFALQEGTIKASGVMPYYSISYGQDIKNHENVGNAYSEYLIQDLLRQDCDYDEVVCTDWCITADEPKNVFDILSGDQCWGVEDNYTVADRHYKLLMAGIDQFGGNKDPQPILAAYQKMVTNFGKDWTDRRFRKSAERILTNMFRIGLFENPYVAPETAQTRVGQAAFVEKGLAAQKKSIVMVKNKQRTLPLTKQSKLYVPKRHYPEQVGWYLDKISARDDYNLNRSELAKSFELVADLATAEAALVRINSPEKAFLRYNGYDSADVKNGGNGYVPISLQYRPYKATEARVRSLAGDPRPGDVLNRSYKDKEITTLNEGDLDQVIQIKQALGDKPLIVLINTSNPFVLSELEPYADVILLEFGVTTKAVVSLLNGEFEPSGLLPFQMPKDMTTVEKQQEDVAFDMEPYVDTEGHCYDFGFGLNYRNVICDERVRQYVVAKTEKF